MVKLSEISEAGGVMISGAELRFQTMEQREWQALPSADTRPGKANVSRLVINHTIEIVQKGSENSAACSLTLQPQNYTKPQVKRSEDGSWVIRFECQNIPECTFEAVSGDPIADHAKFLALPLAIEASKFTGIELTFPHSAAYILSKAPAESAWQAMFMQLMTGKVTLSVGNDEGLFIQQVMEASYGESREQQKQLRTEEGCRIVTRRSKGGKGRSLIVQAWPNKLPAETDLASNAQNFARQYSIARSEIFPATQEVLIKHPNHNRPPGEKISWQLRVLSGLEGLEAPLVGILDNTFNGDDDLNHFAGREEENALLSAMFEDVAEERARASMNDLKAEYDRLGAEAHGFLTKAKTWSLLPVRQLFLKDSRFTGVEENLLPNTPTDLNPEAVTGLNASQVEAVRRTMQYKISVIWGPPATGKSEVLRRIIYQLYIGDNTERIHVSAVTNVAVDQLADRTYDLFKEKFGEDAPMIVRIYSNGQILVQYARADQVRLGKPVNIERLRLNIAEADPDGWRAFLHGTNELQKFGIISNVNAYDAYRKQLNALTEKIMLMAVVVFSTAAGARSSALFQKLKEDDIKAWGATSCIIDEVGCANPGQVLLPIMAYRKTLKRAVLAGDHKQLKAFVQSDEGKRYYGDSWLREIIESGKWPVTMLNLQYRMHKSLYGPVSRIIYDGKVDSYRETDPPSEYLRQLLDDMPMRFYAGSYEYELTTFLNFVDVAHGVSHTILNGSSHNDEEVEAISALVVKLLASGKRPNDICVMTGYLNQLAKLKTASKKDGWSHIKGIISIDTSQGDQYKILIISLVKTSGSPGFIGESERANVACSRAMEAMYFFGAWDFWSKDPDQGQSRLYMHWLLQDMDRYIGQRSLQVNETPRPAFVVSGRTVPAG